MTVLLWFVCFLDAECWRYQMVSSTWGECAGSWPCVWLWPGSSATSASGKDPSQLARCIIFTVFWRNTILKNPYLHSVIWCLLDLLSLKPSCKKHLCLLSSFSPASKIIPLPISMFWMLFLSPWEDPRKQHFVLKNKGEEKEEKKSRIAKMRMWRCLQLRYMREVEKKNL